jgi:glutamate-1-semialdehyde 2,1-aminomutase
MLTLFLGIERARDLSEVEALDKPAFSRFFFAMLERGFYLPPSPFEAMFFSLAHSDADVDDLVASVAAALRGD